MIKHKYKASYHSYTVLINPDLAVNKFYTDIFSSTVIISNIATLQLLSPRKKKKKDTKPKILTVEQLEAGSSIALHSLTIDFRGKLVYRGVVY